MNEMFVAGLIMGCVMGLREIVGNVIVRLQKYERRRSVDAHRHSWR